MGMVPGRDDEEIHSEKKLVDRTRSSAVFVPPQLSDVFNEPLDLARFWSKVDVSTAFQCWPWRGYRTDKGYGRFRQHAAHRLVYELVKGDIPEGLLVRHRCDNPPCCNPEHLLTGTHLDNSADAIERNRLAMGERNGRTKLSAEQAEYIRTNPDRCKQTVLAQRFGIAEATVSYIRSGRSWKGTAA